MGRRLCKVLLRYKASKTKLSIFRYAARKRKTACLLILVCRVDIQKARFFDLGSGDVEILPTRPDLDRNGVINRIGHAACRKSSPDQLIKPELISGQGSFNLHR